MKRIICALLAIACVFTISGCKKKEDDKKSSSSKTSSVSSVVSLVPETGFALEIRPTIKKALELYEIFLVGSLDFDIMQSIDYNNAKYYLVTSTQYKSVAELEKAVSSVFTKNNKDALFGFSKYIDNKGKLYCLDVSSDTKYNWKDFKITVVDKTDSTATLKLSVVSTTSSSSRVEVTITLIKENNNWLISDYESFK